MTSIDDLKRDVQSAQETVLRGLSPEERVRMFARTSAEGADERMEWLRESIPASSHADYREKMLVAIGLSRSATYGLHMGYMQYRLAEEKAQNRLLMTLTLPDLPDAPELDAEKVMTRAQRKVDTAATGLYIEYHGNKRFAEEVLDVDLGEFLALSPSGWLDHIDFGAVLKRAEEGGHITDPAFTDGDGSTEEMPLEDTVEHLYGELVRNWEGDLEEAEA